MLRTLKQKVRKKVENKYNKRYQKECKEKIYTYEKWLEEYRAEGKGLYKANEYRNIKRDVSVIPWSRLEDISELSELKLQDIVVFVHNENGVLKNALEKISVVFNNKPEVSVVYGDEDEINQEKNERKNPWFKPDYSPDTLLSYFYFGSLVAFRKDALKNVVFENDWSAIEKLYAMTLQVCLPLTRERVWHYRDMLYTSTAVSYWGWEDNYQKVKEKYGDIRPKAKEDGVSIIIPSKDNPKVLGRCLESIVKLTQDVNYEIVVIDNGSNEENKKYIEEMKDKLGFNYIYDPMEFNFSHMCNKGAGCGKYAWLLICTTPLQASITPGCGVTMQPFICASPTNWMASLIIATSPVQLAKPLPASSDRRERSLSTLTFPRQTSCSHQPALAPLIFQCVAWAIPCLIWAS